MPLVNIPTVPPEIPKDAQAQLLLNRKMRDLWLSLNKAHKDMFAFIWENPENVSAQQIFDKYGTEAAAIFVLSSKIQEILYMASPTYQPLTPPKPYTINEDGSVTVTEE